ncbi:MAG: glutamyl-tRNA amidotransferase [Oscillospiraceae bacterium]|nr:glutamyl-tRNA amidotransferase [Oscillospiraceae bacterium]
MTNKIFKYNVNLVPLSIKNRKQNAFRDELNNIPYLLYEVETLATGEKIAINKPGGKRNFGRLSRDDFMVFIYNPEEQSLWLISHGEISDDIAEKYDYNREQATTLIKALYKVCCGEEPDDVISELRIVDTVGIQVETILKAYKWIWGQEDCNYPSKEGRWLSMNALLERFNLTAEDCK